MTCPSTVRTAKPEDRVECWRLLLQGHRENGMFPLSPEKVDFFLTRVLQPELIPEWDTGPRGVIGVIGPIGALEGLAFITIGSYWYSSKFHLEEFLVFVDPECRKSEHAKSLIRWMKDQTDATGLPLLTGVVSNERTEAKCRLYRRMLPKVGEFFLYGGKGSGSVYGSSIAMAI